MKLVVNRGKLMVEGGMRWRFASSTVTSSKIAETAEGKKKRKKSTNEIDWKLKLLKTLESEYKKNGQQLRAERIQKMSMAEIMRFTLSDDIQSIIRLAEYQSRLPNRYSNEILPMCLYVLNKKFEKICDGPSEGVNSRQSLSSFISIGNLWRSIRFGDIDRLIGETDEKARNRISTNSIGVLLIGTLRQWKDQRAFDERTKSVDELFETMCDKIRSATNSIEIDELSIFINRNDAKKINAEWCRLSSEYQKPTYRTRFFHQNSEAERYDKNLKLIEKLQKSCEKENYRNNPFQLENMKKENYENLFDAHLKMEKSMWIEVKNTVADKKVEKFGEELLNEWNWRKRIEQELEKIDIDQIHPLVGSCLQLIPRQRLVELLNFSALSACSQGQELISAAQFQHELVTPIIRELENEFKKMLGYSEAEVWKKVFEKYAEYFQNDEISRNFTHREWWKKSCQDQKVLANYQFSIGNFDQETRGQIATIFFEILLKSCLFPIQRKDSSRVIWTPAFSYRSIAIEEESRITDAGRHSLSKMLSIHSQLTRKFVDHPFEHIIFSTETLPMTIPPRPWIDYGTGGPLYTSRVNIIRNMLEFRAVNLNREAQKRIKNRKEARPVFDALNQLGSTPWVINTKMLDVLKNVFEKSGSAASKQQLEKLGIPMRHDTFDVPEFELEFGRGVRKEDVSDEKFRDYAKRKAEAIKMRNESNSLWCWMLYRVVLADHFRDRVLFFPHNMDFRGRVYPLSPYLSHMGDDVNRCILKFAKAHRLGENGFDWLKLHCINLTGKMKRASISDRMKEAERLLPAILDSAHAPLDGQQWWMSSDEPWQTLAACIEISDALHHSTTPSDFPSQLPIHQDGSCNGLQHYAALGRDDEGGCQVNLTKSQLPNDVYSDVAQRVEQKRVVDETNEKDDDGEVARRLRIAMPQNVPRKVIKQTVMTTVYGVTMYGAVMQIKRQLRALGIENEESAIFARYLARKTFSSLNDAFTSSMALKDWFRQCAKGVSELMRTVEWVTPLGLPVVQPYCRLIDRQNKLVLAPIATKQIDAFPPNFVHSLDSTHMMLTSLNCAHRGLTFAAVHDCFWTHAKSVDEMNEICRQQFVGLHSEPIVEQCSKWFIETYLSGKMAKILPENELEKYLNIFTAKVKPGKLNIEEVKESIYFFS